MLWDYVKKNWPSLNKAYNTASFVLGKIVGVSPLFSRHSLLSSLHDFAHTCVHVYTHTHATQICVACVNSCFLCTIHDAHNISLAQCVCKTTHTWYANTHTTQITTSSFATKDKADDIEAFFRENPCPLAETSVKQNCEAIRVNASWLERDRRAVKEWLSGAT